MISKYILVEWPEIQDFMGHTRYNECYSGNPIDESNTMGVWFVPEDLYEEVAYKLQFPKKYESTNLGTVVCYETRAIVNGEDIYWYDENMIKKGSKVLIYNHDIDNRPQWIVSKCVACAEGFPVVFEDAMLLPGINCEIIGVSNDSI